MKKTTEVWDWILGYGFKDSGRALKDEVSFRALPESLINSFRSVSTVAEASDSKTRPLWRHRGYYLPMATRSHQVSEPPARTLDGSEMSLDHIPIFNAAPL